MPAWLKAGARHGMGSASAQLSFTTGVSQVKRSRSARIRAGTASVGSNFAKRAGAERSSATTARRARDPVPACRLDRDCPPAADDNARGRRGGADLGARGLRPTRERGRELPGAADGGGEAVVLAEHGEQPAERTAHRCHGWYVGVGGVACQQEPGRLAAEQLLAHAGGGEQGDCSTPCADGESAPSPDGCSTCAAAHPRGGSGGVVADGFRLVSGGGDATVRVWEATSGRLLHTLTSHAGGVYAVGWQPDGSRLVSGGDDETVRVWEATSGRLLHTLTGHAR